MRVQHLHRSRRRRRTRRDQTQTSSLPRRPSGSRVTFVSASSSSASCCVRPESSVGASGSRTGSTAKRSGFRRRRDKQRESLCARVRLRQSTSVTTRKRPSGEFTRASRLIAVILCHRRDRTKLQSVRSAPDDPRRIEQPISKRTPRASFRASRRSSYLPASTSRVARCGATTSTCVSRPLRRASRTPSANSTSRPSNGGWAAMSVISPARARCGWPAARVR